MGHRPVYTVITARASAPEQIQLLEGIISAAFDSDTDIAVVSNIYNASEYNDNITLENRIYSLICSDRPDGIIITYDSFMNPNLRKYVTELAGMNSIPVISIGSDTGHYPSVTNDTSEDIRAVTDHLIEEHGFSVIDILTGPQDSTEAAARVCGYKKSMSEHGLSFGDDNIIWGDFWTGSGERTAQEYISGKRRLPQAVVCANDYMAFSLCDTFVKNGIKIPDDISVTGYEYVGGRLDHYPVLSTFCRNRKAIGSEAVRRLNELVSGKSTGSPMDLSGYHVPGNTCPCGADPLMMAEETEKLKDHKYYSSLNDTGMLEQYLTKTGSIFDFISALQNHTYLVPDVSGMYLCLYEDWCISRDAVSPGQRDNSELLCYTITDKYADHSGPVRFRSSDIYPDELSVKEKPEAYFCFPLYFMDEYFGYIIVRYDKVVKFGEYLMNWIKIVSNSLEFLRMKNDIDYLMRCQNLSQYSDSFTGLKNREGFLNETAIALRNADQSGMCLMIHIRFLLNETEIAPGSGMLEEHNRLIKEAGKIIRQMDSEKRKICARTGTDSFSIFIPDSDIDSGQYEKERISAYMYGVFRQLGMYGEDMMIMDMRSEKTVAADCRSMLEYFEEKTQKTADEIKKKLNNEEYISFRDLRRSVFCCPERSLTADEACRSFLLSSGHFRVLYKKIFNVSFHQDCIAMKILMAKNLLVSTRMNISAVSEKCSFDNEKYFMRQFRLVSGYTPNQYREMFR